MYNHHRNLDDLLKRVIERVANNIKEQADHSVKLGRKRPLRVERLHRTIVEPINLERYVEEADETES